MPALLTACDQSCCLLPELLLNGINGLHGVDDAPAAVSHGMELLQHLALQDGQQVGGIMCSVNSSQLRKEAVHR